MVDRGESRRCPRATTSSAPSRPTPRATSAPAPRIQLHGRPTDAEHAVHADASGGHRDEHRRLPLRRERGRRDLRVPSRWRGVERHARPRAPSPGSAPARTPSRCARPDAAGNTDATPASVTWLVNPALPALTLALAGRTARRTSDPTPSFSGVAGIGRGRLRRTVTLKIYRPVAGAPDTLVETRTTVRSSLDGSWSVTGVAGARGRPLLGVRRAGRRRRDRRERGDLVHRRHHAAAHRDLERPQGSTAANSASFGFSASEGGSTFECRLDGGAWARVLLAASRTRGLANDVHTFDVRAIDDVGNVDPTPASRTWAVDTSGAPVTLEVARRRRAHERLDAALQRPREHSGGRLRHGERRGLPARGRSGGRARPDRQRGALGRERLMVGVGLARARGRHLRRLRDPGRQQRRHGIQRARVRSRSTRPSRA